VRYCLFIAAVAIVIAWLALGEEIVSEGLDDIGTLRGLLVLIALILVALAIVVRGRFPEAGREAPGELITVAGLAAVTGTTLLSAGEALSGSLFLAIPGAQASFLWDVAGLVVVILLLRAGAGLGTRGPMYVAAFGLFFFIISVGSDLDSDTPEATLLGWPLFLVLVGAAAVAVSLLRGRRPGGPAPPPPGPPPGT
jgi:hypothetical protein